MSRTPSASIKLRPTLVRHHRSEPVQRTAPGPRHAQARERPRTVLVRQEWQQFRDIPRAWGADGRGRHPGWCRARADGGRGSQPRPGPWRPDCPGGVQADPGEHGAALCAQLRDAPVRTPVRPAPQRRRAAARAGKLDHSISEQAQRFMQAQAGSPSPRCQISVRSDQRPPAPESGHGSWQESVSFHHSWVSGSAAIAERSLLKSSPWYSK